MVAYRRFALPCRAVWWRCVDSRDGASVPGERPGHVGAGASVSGELWGGAGCRWACGALALGRVVVRLGAMFTRQIENQAIVVDQRSGPQFVNKRRIESRVGVGELFSSIIRPPLG